jgi:hypothetical protein
MNEFILKESISLAGLESPAEFEHYIITDGKTIILAKDDQEDDGQAIMLLAVMNAYGGTIWVDNSDKLIIGHQKEEIKWLSEQLAAKDKEIERLKKLASMAFIEFRNKPIPIAEEGWQQAWKLFCERNNLFE